MNIFTKSVHIRGTSGPARAIIRALCDFGTDDEPREPSIAEKRAAIRQVLGELVAQTDWAILPDSPVALTKKQIVTQYRRLLLRADLSDPESVEIPESPAITLADFHPIQADNVQGGAVVAAQNIPGWASWTESTAEAWYSEHISAPLNASLPATISAATNRQILIALISIMRDMGVMLWALARMVIALRNNAWPGLQNGNGG